MDWTETRLQEVGNRWGLVEKTAVRSGEKKRWWGAEINRSLSSFITENAVVFGLSLNSISVAPPKGLQHILFFFSSFLFSSCTISFTFSDLFFHFSLALIRGNIGRWSEDIPFECRSSILTKKPKRNDNKTEREDTYFLSIVFLWLSLDLLCATTTSDRVTLDMSPFRYLKRKREGVEWMVKVSKGGREWAVNI